MAEGTAALSIGGEPFAYLAAGSISLESQTRFDETSLCRIHSMTKSVTGIATMLLVDGGKLSRLSGRRRSSRVARLTGRP
jgi:CubicO group peptidase (beta-lactamase class C family)